MQYYARMTSKQTGGSEANSGGRLVLSWRAVGIVSFVVSLVSLAVAAIVSETKRADTLAVIALALAIVAIIVQLIVFIVQTTAAGRQEVRGEQVYGQTIRALSAIEEKAEGTRQIITTMNDQMLAALIRTLPEAQQKGISVQSPGFEELLTRAAADVASGALIQDHSQSGRVSGPRPDLRAPMERTHRNVRDPSVRTAPPDDVARQASTIIENLPTEAIEDIVGLANDQERFGDRSDQGGVSAGVLSVNNPKQLYDAGLILKIRQPWGDGDRPVFVLSELGKNVARTLLADSVSVKDATLDTGRRQAREWDNRLRDPFGDILLVNNWRAVRPSAPQRGRVPRNKHLRQTRSGDTRGGGCARLVEERHEGVDVGAAEEAFRPFWGEVGERRFVEPRDVHDAVFGEMGDDQVKPARCSRSDRRILLARTLPRDRADRNLRRQGHRRLRQARPGPGRTDPGLRVGARRRDRPLPARRR